MTGHSLRPILPPYRTRKDFKVDELKTSKDVAKHLKFQDVQITRFWKFFFESYFKSVQSVTRRNHATRQIKVGKMNTDAVTKITSFNKI